MQKKLIALALASLAGSAFAQSNVTMYGVVDLGQAWVKASESNGDQQKNVGRLDSNSSYIGFKGVEDLGNGLKAVFQYETAFAADNGGGLTGGRDSFIGLAGGFGTVAAGNLTHPLRAMGAKVELTPGAAGFGTMASLTGTLAGTKTGADDRAANAIAYISPSFSGFTAVVAYVNGENKTNATPAVAAVAGGTNPDGTISLGTPAIAARDAVNQRAYQVAGQYENGPLFAALAYHKANDFAAIANADATVWRAAATYTFPSNTKLTALYDNTKVKEIADGDDVKRAAWSLGVAQGFGAHTVGVEYARAGKLKAGGESVEETNANMWSAIYTYALSKRTMAHVRYSKLNNGENVANNFYLNPVNNGGAVGFGSNVSGFMAGVRHSF